MSSILYYVRQLYAFAGKRLFFNFAGMLLIGVMESVGILLIVPLLSVAGLFERSTNEFLDISWLVRLFEEIPKTQGLILILALYLLIIIGQGLFHRHQTLANKKIEQGFIRRLREETYKGLIQSNWEFFLRHRKTDLVKLLTSEIASVKKGLNIIQQFSTMLVFAAVKLAVAFWLAPAVTAVTICFGAVLLCASHYFTRKSKQFGRENLLLSKQYLARITDHLHGMKEIKGNTLELSHIDWNRHLCRTVEQNSINFTKVRTNAHFLYRTISAVLLVCFIGFMVSAFPSQPLQLLVVTLLFARLWPIVTRIQSNIEKLAMLVPSFEALMELQEQSRKAKETSEEDLEHTDTVQLKTSLALQNISFQYDPNGDGFALKNISLCIPANGMTAIVGPSGAGKSTLVDIILGLNRAQQGTILLDGVPLTDANLLSLRRSISYVPQDPFLFHASIRENLLVMKPSATEEELWEALDMACALELVKQLPYGLDTYIGDRGVRLSGGERQRIVFARALLRKPSILILDEATSALDMETELKVKETLDKLMGTMTIIAIAHRPSTIRSATHRIALHKGELVDAARSVADSLIIAAQ